MSLSVPVGDLEAALDLVNGNTGRGVVTFEYNGRDRFLIPASLTHELLIEIVEAE